MDLRVWQAAGTISAFATWYRARVNFEFELGQLVKRHWENPNTGTSFVTPLGIEISLMGDRPLTCLLILC